MVEPEGHVSQRHTADEPGSRARRDRHRPSETREKARGSDLVCGKPSSHGKRIAFDGPSRTVIDGPFAETKELVAGFWLWEVKDMAEAIAWAKRCPNPMPGPSELEIRPLYEAVDFQ